MPLPSSGEISMNTIMNYSNTLGTGKVLANHGAGQQLSWGNVFHDNYHGLAATANTPRPLKIGNNLDWYRGRFRFVSPGGSANQSRFPYRPWVIGNPNVNNVNAMNGGQMTWGSNADITPANASGIFKGFYGGRSLNSTGGRAIDANTSRNANNVGEVPNIYISMDGTETWNTEAYATPQSVLGSNDTNKNPISFSDFYSKTPIDEFACDCDCVCNCLCK